METLLPFNSICAACASRRASFRYCLQECESDGNGGYEAHRVIGGQAPIHHLHRKCDDCGYEWLERCLGLAPPADHVDTPER